MSEQVKNYLNETQRSRLTLKKAQAAAELVLGRDDFKKLNFGYRLNEREFDDFLTQIPIK